MRLFWRRSGPFAELERRLGYRFSDGSHLATALTHRSHAYEQLEGEQTNYERLEFLGDALLGLFVSEWLFRDDPLAAEGVLTRRRQIVVRTTTLAEQARDLGLDAELRLGKGEERTGGREKVSLMADTFEAVLGAVYIDGGVRPAQEFVQRHLAGVLQGTRGSLEAADDYKTRLQEAVQAKLRQTPRYRIVSTSGPAHALRFRVEVLIDGSVFGSGDGTNRKRAEQQAARAALARVSTDGE